MRFFDDIIGDFQKEFSHFADLRSVACPAGALTVPKDLIEHFKLHLPSLAPGCKICSGGKLARKPAKKVPEGEARRAEKFGQVVHVDTVGPTDAAVDGEARVIVARDDATDFPIASGVKDAESATAWRAMREMFDIEGGEITGVRTDKGEYFQGEFDAGCKKFDVKRTYGLPRRSQTGSAPTPPPNSNKRGGVRLKY